MEKHMTVYRVAARDIVKYQSDKGFVSKSVADKWTVNIADLQTKETRRLNRALGLHKVNK
jgi:hypothetical protein